MLRLMPGARQAQDMGQAAGTGSTSRSSTTLDKLPQALGGRETTTHPSHLTWELLDLR